MHRYKMTFLLIICCCAVSARYLFHLLSTIAIPKQGLAKADGYSPNRLSTRALRKRCRLEALRSGGQLSGMSTGPLDKSHPGAWISSLAHGLTWIRHTSNQLILYHPSSHALAVQPHSVVPKAGPSRPTRPLLLPYRTGSPAPEATAVQQLCPTCSQPIEFARSGREGLPSGVETPSKKDRGYFQILEEAHEGSRPPSPSPRRTERTRTRTPTPFTTHQSDQDEDTLDERDFPAKGYYDRYFREEGRLGMGAEGSVFLATHVIGDNVLGQSAHRADGTP